MKRWQFDVVICSTRNVWCRGWKRWVLLTKNVETVATLPAIPDQKCVQSAVARLQRVKSFVCSPVQILKSQQRSQLMLTTTGWKRMSDSEAFEWFFSHKRWSTTQLNKLGNLNRHLLLIRLIAVKVKATTSSRANMQDVISSGCDILHHPMQNLSIQNLQPIQVKNFVLLLHESNLDNLQFIIFCQNEKKNLSSLIHENVDQKLHNHAQFLFNVSHVSLVAFVGYLVFLELRVHFSSMLQNFFHNFQQ